jgi:hypothetical protein
MMKSTLNRKFVGAVAASATLLVPLGVFGGPALAGGSSASSAQYQYRVTVCHLTGSKKHPYRTIKVAASAVNAVIKHGGHRDACVGNETRKAKAKKTSASTKAQSGSTNVQSGSTHGKSSSHKKP